MSCHVTAIGNNKRPSKKFIPQASLQSEIMPCHSLVGPPEEHKSQVDTFLTKTRGNASMKPSAKILPILSANYRFF